MFKGKIILRQIAALLSVQTGAAHLFSFRGLGFHRILMYHRVLEPNIEIEPGMYVKPKTFRRHLEVLTRRYRVLPLNELCKLIANHERIPRNTVSITFDDGWVDNYYFAFPLLREFQVPATIFLITGSIGKEGYLSWDQIHEMNRGGISFGLHTDTHAILSHCEEASVRNELNSSLLAFKKQNIEFVRAFCYPKGEYNRDSQAILAEMGWEFALGVQPKGDSNNSPKILGRIGMHEDVSYTKSMFEFRLITGK